MTTAVCYVASAGHLFQTALSATQARTHVARDVQVYVVFVSQGRADQAELRAFSQVLGRHDVVVLHLAMSVLRGHHPVFGRLFLDLVLPPDVDRILYLDGDTQVVGDLSPLLEHSPPPGGLAAVRDPMVLLSLLDHRLSAQIRAWWDLSGISEATRQRYINSGVLLMDRSSLARVRTDALREVAAQPGLVFSDQDAINLAHGLDVELLSTSWNFPGFLLGTRVERVAPPQVVHFMSDPRPWQGAFHPWGRQFFEPYRLLAEHEPILRPYWRPFPTARSYRYTAQQAFKGLTERRHLVTDEAETTARELENDAGLQVTDRWREGRHDP